MKRWAILVVLLYAVMLALLTLPVCFLATLEHNRAEGGWHMGISVEELFGLFLHWGWWLWLLVMAAGQALLLLVPVSVASRRPERRQKLMVPVFAASFFLGNVVFAGCTALFCAVLPKDMGPELLFWPAEVSAKALSVVPANPGVVTAAGNVANSEWGAMLLGLVYMMFFWLVWGFLFFRYARDDSPEALTQRAVRWLLRGSILELLVAVPSHVFIRHRGDCCAPAATFWGITVGLSVMLLAFGPGVFFLFVERARRLQPKT